ncbi:hypothetical protein JTB14_031256 [Gonioctena quinquepunctata]|nr:hypothetical protein JTB14_031256 [Gonioctena quinquepunctata]
MESSREIIDKIMNVKSPPWGASHADNRGKYVAEWLASLDLLFVNKGNKPTPERGKSTPHFDVTLASSTFIDRVTEWKVLDEETFSCHE